MWQEKGFQKQIDVHLRRQPEEPINHNVQDFYKQLFPIITKHQVFRNGSWQYYNVFGTDTSWRLMAWGWSNEQEKILCVLNFSDANAVGKILSIPMPGHPVSKEDLESTKNILSELESLVQDHDAVFILMDSRESRWLPTLMCMAKAKLALNVALGFDTYLVIRHGISNKLGCYFCNDVVAPQNSLKDRTLDQQCTVTRPGLSSIASSVAVELLVSILQHPLGANAPAETNTDISTPNSGTLGVLPHSIRGFLPHFTNLQVTGHPFDKCTACSDLVVNEYKSKGVDFLLQAFNSPTYLEDITGLTKMKQESEDVQWEIQKDDDF